MATIKLPAHEKSEVRVTSATGKVYLITYNPLKQARFLYLVSDSGALKKMATGKTPTDLYPKVV